MVMEYMHIAKEQRDRKKNQSKVKKKEKGIPFSQKKLFV